jgi:hypothetical protein
MMYCFSPVSFSVTWQIKTRVMPVLVDKLFTARVCSGSPQSSGCCLLLCFSCGR